MLNNGCNDFLFGVHCVEEGDRIPPAAELWTGVETEKLMVSWVMTVVRLPISWSSSLAMPSHVPAVSIAMG